MCGIFFYLALYLSKTKQFLKECANKIAHRGPDQSYFSYESLNIDGINEPNIAMAFHRLAINDLSPAGMQPFFWKGAILMCNGQIYNSASLRKFCAQERPSETFSSKSDCEVIVHLYNIFGRGMKAVNKLIETLHGEYAFVIYDEITGEVMAGRDFGIRPLFYLKTSNEIIFASEMIALMPFIAYGFSEVETEIRKIHPFPPKSIFHYKIEYYSQIIGVENKLKFVTFTSLIDKDLFKIKNADINKDSFKKGLASSLLTSFIERGLDGLIRNSKSDKDINESGAAAAAAPNQKKSPGLLDLPLDNFISGPLSTGSSDPLSIASSGPLSSGPLSPGPLSTVSSGPLSTVSSGPLSTTSSDIRSSKSLIIPRSNSSNFEFHSKLPRTADGRLIISKELCKLKSRDIRSRTMKKKKQKAAEKLNELMENYIDSLEKKKGGKISLGELELENPSFFNFMRSYVHLTKDLKFSFSLTPCESWSWKAGNFYPVPYPLFRMIDIQETERVIYYNLKTILINAVINCLDSDRDICFSLSGGLDSSLNSAIGARILKLSSFTSSSQNKRIKTFSIGTGKNSPDLRFARLVAEHIGSDHTEVLFTPEEGIAAIPDVIKALGSFDTTTIRASTPQYLLAKYIKENTNYRVIISGEGSDELLYGYLMWMLSPNPEASQKVSEELVRNLLYYDCLRTDRVNAHFGLEVRVPYLSDEFVRFALSIPPEFKQPKSDGSSRIEKFILRKAFDQAIDPWLPKEVLYRTKAAFSDAVGIDWIDALKNIFLPRFQEIPETLLTYHCPPRTPEEEQYRRCFEYYYPGQASVIPDFWKIRFSDVVDPSAARLFGHRG